MKVSLLFVVLLTTACATARPIVIAHRGASGYLPEHSLAAVTAAHIMNVDYIEQDVVLSKDGVPVVLHDIHLESTTDVENIFPARSREDGRYYAADFTLAELKELTLHERAKKNGDAVYPLRFPVQATTMRIPTLAEEIELIQGLNKSRNKDIGLYVELKKPAFHRDEKLDLAGAVLSTLSKYGYRNQNDKVFLQCFESRTLKELKQKTSLRLVQLIGVNSWNESSDNYEKMLTKDGLADVAVYAQGIGPYIGSFLEMKPNKASELMAFARKSLNLEVHPYTFRADAVPNQLESFAELVRYFSIELGVSGLFSDHPDQAIEALKQK